MLDIFDGTRGHALTVLIGAVSPPLASFHCIDDVGLCCPLGEPPGPPPGHTDPGTASGRSIPSRGCIEGRRRQAPSPGEKGPLLFSDASHACKQTCVVQVLMEIVAEKLGCAVADIADIELQVCGKRIRLQNCHVNSVLNMHFILLKRYSAWPVVRLER